MTDSLSSSPAFSYPFRSVDLSIVVPTYCEVELVEELVKRITAVMKDVDWEIIFVDDDSPDGTAERVRAIARGDRRVRLLQRFGRRGLSSACIEGMLASSAPYLAVMDADLQHDERLLPLMLQTLRSQDLDLVVGSRYVQGGTLGDWQRSRRLMSRVATRLARWVTRADLKDPMSGFFMLRDSAFHACVHRLSGVGFKLLLDLFSACGSRLRFRELPYSFRSREVGVSKLDSASLWEYGLMLSHRLSGSLVPVRFIAFSAVGSTGVLVHLTVLGALLHWLGQDSFLVGHASATLVAMSSNFFLNNALTYRDRRLRGWAMLRGWWSFVMVCSIGAVANVGVANVLFQTWDSSWFVSALAGILVGAVWNYAVTGLYTWTGSQGTWRGTRRSRQAE